nr:hypothetical protein CFP56_26512 [Quercus suber]
MVDLCETRKEEVVLKILKDEKENAASGDWLMEIFVKEGVLIKDDLPPLKTVCDKIEELDNKSLFTSTTPTNLEEALVAVPELITDEINSILTAEYMREEVDEALNQMEPLKA